MAYNVYLRVLVSVDADNEAEAVEEAMVQVRNLLRHSGIAGDHPCWLDTTQEPTVEESNA